MALDRKRTGKIGLPCIDCKAFCSGKLISILELAVAVIFSCIMTKVSCPKTQQHGVPGILWRVQTVKHF